MTDKNYKIVWSSNAPWCGTGYGNQTALFAPMLHEAGWDVTIAAFYGVRGAILNVGYARVVPGLRDAWGNDVLVAHAQAYKPDVVFALQDIWVLADDVIERLPLASWCPVDHTPIPPGTVGKLLRCKYPIAMSQHGERMMRQSGFDPFYIPHGVDTEVFAPHDRAEARQKWNFPEDAFIVAVVAANKGFPSRKSLDRILKAWSEFVITHPTAILYMHTDPSGLDAGAPNLADVRDFYGIPRDSVIFPDAYRLGMGQYPDAALADLYNAADVLLAPSMGEGFGIPVIQAQACGCPVIVSKFTSQPELVRGGLLLELDPRDDQVWTWQSSEQVFLPVSKLITALEWAYDMRGNETLREQAHKGMAEYDVKHVFQRYMLPTLTYIAEAERAEKSAKNELIELMEAAPVAAD